MNQEQENAENRKNAPLTYSEAAIFFSFLLVLPKLIVGKTLIIMNQNWNDLKNLDLYEKLNRHPK